VIDIPTPPTNPDERLKWLRSLYGPVTEYSRRVDQVTSAVESKGLSCVCMMVVDVYRDLGGLEITPERWDEAGCGAYSLTNVPDEDAAFSQAWNAVHNHVAGITPGYALRRLEDARFRLNPPREVHTSHQPLPKIALSLGDLLQKHATMRPPLIDNLLRRGEIMSLVSQAKVGKSWLSVDLVTCAALGRPWLGQNVARCNSVVLLDNELHPETLSARFRAWLKYQNLNAEDTKQVLSAVTILPLRGRLRNVYDLSNVLEQTTGNADLVVLDALYRFFPSGFSENDNADAARLVNELDAMATERGSAFVYIHHSSKGDQSRKDTVDIGAGAGAFARAVDCHGAIYWSNRSGAWLNKKLVFNAAPRSFAPFSELVLNREIVTVPGSGSNGYGFDDETIIRFTVDADEVPEWTLAAVVKAGLTTEWRDRGQFVEALRVAGMNKEPAGNQARELKTRWRQAAGADRVQLPFEYKREGTRDLYRRRP
jgi:hypothetical protein